MTTRKVSTEERESAQAQLREMFPVGSIVSTHLNHVSRSGMMRAVSVMHGNADGSVEDVSWLVARATGDTFNQRYGGITLGGCGMDMGYALVYGLSRTLYRDGFTCTGHATGPNRCPANDHSNDYGERSRAWYATHAGHFTSELYSASEAERYSTSRVHSDPGYALSHRWI